MLSLLLVLVELAALVALMVLLHRGSVRFGLVPLFAYLSGLAVLTQATAYVYVIAYEPRISVNSSTLFVPVIMLAVLVLYAIDGTVAARQAVLAIVGLSLLVFFAAAFNQARVRWLGEESLVPLVPGPRGVLNPSSVLVSIIAFTSGLQAVVSAYQFVSNRAPRLASPLAPGVAILAGLWVDALLFSLLHGMPGSDTSWGRVARDLTGKTAAGVLLWPLATAYIARAARRQPQSAVREPRPVFDMLFGLQGRMETDLSRARVDLRQERDLMSRLMATSPVGIVRVDRDGRFAFANDQAGRVLGLARSRLVGRTYDDPAWKITDEAGGTFAPERLPFARVRETVAPVYGVRHAVEWPDGRRAILSVNAAPLLDAGGAFDGMVAIIDDITERRRGEAEREALIHELEARNEALQLQNSLAGHLQRRLGIEAIAEETVAVLIRHSQPPLVAFYVLEEDRATLRLVAAHGFSESERAIGATLPVKGSLSGLAVAQGRLLVAEDLTQDERVFPEMRRALTRRGVKATVVIPLAFGGEMLGTVNLVFDRARTFSPVDLDTFEAIGQTVALALSNARHVAWLEAKNAELERFTYTVSHDLKSPLVTIRGFLGFLVRSARSGDERRLEEDIRRIEAAAGSMERLLNDLLELSRVGRQMNTPQHVPVDAVVREAAALVDGALRARGARVVIAPELPVVYGDRVRLVQVVQNLLDNAIKFSGDATAPRIEIGWRDAGPGSVRVFVRDDGIGIEASHHEKVFGLFDKIDGRSQGTGVGLALVKRIVEAHGGRVWVESAGQGRGSCFWLELPGQATAAGGEG
jgi:PAS domain S-box-containing protein